MFNQGLLKKEKRFWRIENKKNEKKHEKAELV
jgi:hypothetical protein